MALSELGRPSRFHFTCTKCDKSQSLSLMVETMGNCRKCNGANWTLELEFELEADGEALARKASALAMFAATGSPLSLLDANPDEPVRISVPGVSSHDAMTLALEGGSAANVLHYAQQREAEAAEKHRERIKQAGGECPECATLFVREEHKPWTVAGYCSRVCRAKGENAKRFDPNAPGKIKPLEKQEKGPRRGSKLLAVTCACTHKFEVPRMYAGTMRPCPECGEKVTVPG